MGSRDFQLLRATPRGVRVPFQCVKRAPGMPSRACAIWYFEWLDSDVSERVAKVIRGLLKRLDKQETEMQRKTVMEWPNDQMTLWPNDQNCQENCNGNGQMTK
nr:uncharacterized protein LOC109193259 [Ipomoea batatas]